MIASCQKFLNCEIMKIFMKFNGRPFVWQTKLLQLSKSRSIDIYANDEPVQSSIVNECTSKDDIIMKNK